MRRNWIGDKNLKYGNYFLFSQVPFFLFNGTDVDECLNEEANQCDPNALCINTEGSFVCRCLKGYEEDGENCSGKCACFDQPPIDV